MATAPSSNPHTTIKLNRASDQQLRNIIEALMGTQDFSNWAVVLSTTDPSTFPLTATLFIPSDNALSNITPTEFRQFHPSIFAYHIIPQQLNFSLLKTFKIGSRIPTLLPNNTILVTTNSESNYTIDDSQIIHPDLYINGAIAVHGIGSLLNYSVFGGGFLEDHQIPNQSPPDEPSSPGIDDNDDHKKPIMGNQSDHNMGFEKSNGRSCNISTPERILMKL
ncbi:FAS1 domain [Macleaya cordata]|uniref:FAS1 domain n=1 Tax=Macleaya cordata TaxID=56857 RepID=A0A200QHV7_MACCD|nr:FAS1 domain [Macleaya cordata]